LSVAYAFSTRAILEREMQLAEERYHQQILVLSTYELRFQSARDELFHANQKLATVVRTTDNDVSAGSAADSATPADPTPAEFGTLIILYLSSILSDQSSS
jgi:hypothetical protein